jgi:hypothetical protein
MDHSQIVKIRSGRAKRREDHIAFQSILDCSSISAFCLNFVMHRLTVPGFLAV